ncbi:chemotaxis protein CheA [Vibrio sp. 05-20-BW147]|uniref:chemotaxis protein CheA n=1 Tax=Vibrio sp. 05-20-BW147 TaxID=2575834 RepID=UPI0015937374|nr:chemotaxis protein CheA [Vibrio sp. 05-20-BW147]NVC61809.1 chemotaxis protein CheA [Vibrio sp. 05-20-BW147]
MNDPRFAKALLIFINEAEELLDEMEQALLENNAEWINTVFRAVHTIKGSAGLFGLDDMVRLAHQTEAFLVPLRETNAELDETVLAYLLDQHDELNKQMQTLVLQSKSANSICDDLIAKQSDHHSVSNVMESRWVIHFKPNANVFKDGLDPISFIRYLQKLGTVCQLETHFSDCPTPQQFDPEACYISFQLEFQGSVSQQAIEDVFEFIAADAQISITPIVDKALPLAPVIKAEMPRLTQPTLPKARTLRVEADKLDKLIDLVGEMVIAGARTNLLTHQTGDEALIEAVAQLERLVESIRDHSLQLRMVQIGDSLTKFKRVVRDVASELGKEVQLVVAGGDTELDKSFVEKLSDPLTHIIRNAIDHGIENIEERLAKGKKQQGVIKINAYHESGLVVLEISDDGRGLSKSAIEQKARERGLLAEGDELTPLSLNNLIFEPGFSTKQTVTDLSGRGVGMDVVKRNIESLRGNIEVHSKEDVGTTLTIRLPLTLSIIDGFMFRVAQTDYVIPLDSVVECLELKEVIQESSINANRYLDLRGEVLPFIDLCEWFAVESHTPFNRRSLVVLQYGTFRAGLLVDELIGEYQTVVKPLGPLFDGVRGVSGATILGSGEVAVILDVFALIQTVVDKTETKLDRAGILNA